MWVPSSPGWRLAATRVTVDTRPTPRQRHDVRVEVSSFDDADTVATVLGERGFERWDRWTGAAARSFVPTRSRSRWREPNATASSCGCVGPPHRVAVVPDGCSDRCSAPPKATGPWSGCRTTALAARTAARAPTDGSSLERVGRRDPHAAGLGPFLSTPASLIDPLFTLARLGADDTLLDIGCGDGRLAIAAAREVGCRAIGVEHDAELATRAGEAATVAGVDDLVSIRHGDARDTDLSEVTVAFMFLPMGVVAEIVADTLDRLPDGARLIVHEQSPLPDSMTPEPDTSHAVIAADAVTVAHVWSRSGRPGRVAG